MRHRVAHRRQQSIADSKTCRIEAQRPGDAAHGDLLKCLILCTSYRTPGAWTVRPIGPTPSAPTPAIVTADPAASPVPFRAGTNSKLFNPAARGTLNSGLP